MGLKEWICDNFKGHSYSEDNFICEKCFKFLGKEKLEFIESRKYAKKMRKIVRRKYNHKRKYRGRK